MATKTKNYDLIKPTENDYYDVNVQNNNMDIIDTALKEVSDSDDAKLQIGKDYRPNLLINGDFQVWQRGTSFNIAAGEVKYTADRWIGDGFGTHAYTVSKDTNGVLLPASPSEVRSLENRIELTDAVRNNVINKKVSYTISVDGIIYTGTCVLTSTSGINLKGASDTSLRFEWNALGSTCISIYITFRDVLSHIVNYIKVELNDHATSFISKSYGDELIACQRYYEKYDFNSSVCQSGYQVIGFPFKVDKRVNPTMTFKSQNGTLNKLSAWGALNIYATVLSSMINTEGVELINTDNAVSGSRYVYSWVADAEL
jgi:hypothetical protein